MVSKDTLIITTRENSLVFSFNFWYYDVMKKKILITILLIISLITFLYALFIKAVNSGTNFYLMWILIGLFFVGLSILIYFDIFVKYKLLKKIFITLISICLIIFVVIESLIISKMNIKSKNNLDYIIVLGAQVKASGPSVVLEYRLDETIKYLNENENTLVVVSGGKGINEPDTEANIMKNYLIGNGINEERIIVEDKSHSTKENIINSKKLIMENKSVGIVTNDFHLFRALQIANKNGIDAYGIPSKSTVIYLPNNLLREFFAEIKFLIFH